jgi:subtilisin-like proprotein convertase family protein
VTGSTRTKWTVAPAALIAFGCVVLFEPEDPSARTTACATSTFTATDVPKSIPDPGTSESTLALPAGEAIADIDVRVQVSHSFDSDLRIRLVSPAGTTVTLAETVGMWGDNFTGSVFDDEASSSIISNLPPFTGRFHPADALSTLDGSLPAGTWKLQLKDERARYAGTLDGWGLDVTTCTGTIPAKVRKEAGAPDPPPLPSGVPTGAEGIEGTLITVTNNSQVVNGTTSSVAGLQSSPGPDGISLREATIATDFDPGQYTIQFTPSLKGATIGMTYGLYLTGGRVFIDGDIDADGLPDITLLHLDGADQFPLQISSSNNRLHALKIEGGWHFGVGIYSVVNLPWGGSTSANQPIVGNVISGLVVSGLSGDGVVAGIAEGAPAWTDNRFVGNTIGAGAGGISIGPTSEGNILERTTAAGNRIQLDQAEDQLAGGIRSEAGFGTGNDGARVSDFLIAYNSIEGNGEDGIAFHSGAVGGKSNTIEDVSVFGNKIAMEPRSNGRVGPAIGFAAGDGASDFACPDCLPIVYSDDNIVRNVEISANSLTETDGIVFQAACCGNAGNLVEHVTIQGNDIHGSGKSPGVGVSGGSSDSESTRPSASNEISDFTVRNNSVTTALTGPGGVGVGGIFVLGARGNARTATLHDLHILDNMIDTHLIGIHLIGGLQTPPPLPDAAANNAVSGVEVRGNVIVQVPLPVDVTYPGAKGIALTGGYLHTTGNRVTSVAIQGNMVAGIGDDFSVRSNVEAGASGNLAALGTAQPTLAVSKAGSGAGTVTSNPTGIDCGSTCSSGFDDRNDVTLTATAAAGSSFTGWSGDCSGTGTCTVTMTPSRSVTATFETDKTLTVAKGGTGAGSVSSSPTGIDCGATCSHAYAHGNSVTLTPTAQTGSSFSGWSGDCSGSGTCTLTMSADHSATATFESDKVLTIAKRGSGSGTVSSSPAGIDCGGTCSHAYTHGTSIILTATAQPRSRFSGWSGDCAGTSICTLTMSADHSAAATFVALCIVPNVKGRKLAAAKSAITRAKCSVGTVTRAFSAKKKGTVISQKPAPGATRAKGAKVNLTLSKGPRPKR